VSHLLSIQVTLGAAFLQELRLSLPFLIALTAPYSLMILSLKLINLENGNGVK
jgi:hypothetical protein